MTKLLRALATIAMAGGLLAGCTAARTARDDAAVRAVGVVSLVDESGPIRRLGLTVFNNNEAAVAQDGKLAQVVVDTVRDRLKASRPGWTVKVGDIAQMPGARKPGPGKRLTSDDPGALADLARRLDVDQLFVVEDTRSENFPGHGVGITFRSIGADPGSVLVHAFVALVVVDRDGKILVTRGATKDNPQRVPTSELALRSDLGTAGDPKVREQVSQALQRRLKASVEEAMTRAGY